MKDSKTIQILSLGVVIKEETLEASGIVKAAVMKKYGTELKEVSESEYDGKNAINFVLDSTFPLKKYIIDISDESNTVTITAGNVESLYYAVQRLVRSMMGEEPKLEVGCIDSEMLIVSDPSILAYNGKYYLSSFVATPNGGNSEQGYEVYVGENLYEWSAPVRVFTASECDHPDFDGIKNYWAPEICEYRGKFYIFATYRSKATNHRGSIVLRSDTPDGKYELISRGHITPPDWDCIDSSLYIDENGDPWCVFVHEWTSMPDKIGGMCVARMTEDLTALDGEITQIFRANDAPWNRQNGVTDGPHIYRFESGKLAMIWSGYWKNGYCIGVAYSENGICGPWVQKDELLYGKGIGDYRYGREGGHGFMFKDLNGRLMMAYHGPNNQKGVYCVELDTEGDELKIK